MVAYIGFTAVILGSLGCIVYKIFVEPKKWMRNHSNGNQGTLSAVYRKHLTGKVKDVIIEK